MIVKKTTPLSIECVVRGYLAGSGWKEYQATGTLSGSTLPKNLRHAEMLPEPLFTPSTKAEVGHDEPISWDQCCQLIGRERAEQVRAMSLQLYTEGARYACKHGIIIADTKFEFGLLDQKLLLIDECLTPDSSRFWPMESYRVGENPPSFDKQFLRDYLETSRWNKQPPAPSLPEEIVMKTAQKYREAWEQLTGKKSA
jgi:phosphoribosylaminoimidazole-succinocarboxamide synthase